MTPQLMHNLQVAATQNPILDSHLRQARRHQTALDEALASAVLDLVRANAYLQGELLELISNSDREDPSSPSAPH